MTTQPETLNFAELANLLGIAVHTLRRRYDALRAEGLPGPRFGSGAGRRWHRDTVRAWLAGGTAPELEARAEARRDDR